MSKTEEHRCHVCGGQIAKSDNSFMCKHCRENPHVAHQAAYSQGYKDALKWIPVEERLPEGDHGHALIAYDKSGDKRVYVSFWCRSNDDSFLWNYDHAMKCVTHWMPLPEGPRSLPIPEAK